MQERFAKRGITSAQEWLNRILTTNGAEDQRCADEKTWKRERFSSPVIFNMMITNIARGSWLHVTSDNYLDSNRTGCTRTGSRYGRSNGGTYSGRLQNLIYVGKHIGSDGKMNCGSSRFTNNGVPGPGKSKLVCEMHGTLICQSL